MICNGWEIYFIKRVFGEQRHEIHTEVRRLKKTLPSEDYFTHAKVKLYTAIMVAIKERIPEDPFAEYYTLSGSLKKYGRVKKMGLPKRYRLFFRAFEDPKHKAIFVLWLGYPRKQGAKNDCYTIFTKMVARGDYPESYDDLLLLSDEG